MEPREYNWREIWELALARIASGSTSDLPTALRWAMNEIDKIRPEWTETIRAKEPTLQFHDGTGEFRDVVRKYTVTGGVLSIEDTYITERRRQRH